MYYSMINEMRSYDVTNTDISSINTLEDSSIYLLFYDNNIIRYIFICKNNKMLYLYPCHWRSNRLDISVNIVDIYFSSKIFRVMLTGESRLYILFKVVNYRSCCACFGAK